jgi:hypothetical protein
MQLYWGGGETFLEPNIQGGLVRSGRIALDYWVAVLLHPEFLDVLPPAVVLVIMSISLVGAVTIARRSSVAAVMLFTPAMLAALASFAKLWPLHPRLLLFAAPAVLITVASGVFTLADRAPRPMKALLHVVPSSLLLVGTAAALFLEWAANPRVAALPDALRELPARVGTSATVYLSFDLEPLCTYYLGWHPDRSELPGDPSQRHCAIPGVDIIIGNGPEYEGIAPGAAGGRGRRVRPEWLEKETQQILTGAPAEVWLFVGYVTELHRDLPNWFEAHGVGPGERHDRRAIVVRRYTPPSDSNVQLGRSVD